MAIITTTITETIRTISVQNLNQLMSRTTYNQLYGAQLGGAGLLRFNTISTPSQQLQQANQPNQGNTMPAKFKIGDTVEIKSQSFGWGTNGAQPGDIGTVVNTDSGYPGIRYFLDIPARKETGWMCSAKDIESYSGSVEPQVKVDFDSVIMADGHRQQILDALGQIEDYELIFKTWGFESIMEKGKAISMLFWGPPGTGKTLCAQAIADHLGKKLKIISTADVESSAPGQAERNLKAHFEQGKNDVLLFDECDSLVYSRDAVGSILGAQINQLLSSLEHFDGVAIFTTNRLGVLDEAFNRRLSLKLEFAMPTEDQRLLIWQRMFPEKCPVDKNMDWAKLAKIEITGGYIKNIVLRAARTAARHKHEEITYEVVIEATKSEIKSMQEFEKARQQHKSGIGMAGWDGMGQRMIRSIKKEMSNE